MGVDFEEIGRVLRQRREELGLTLRDVQAATKIRLRYLEALERGDTGTLPPDVYARGFVRAYAAYLGLDGVELARAYQAAQEAVQGTATQPSGPERLEARPPARRTAASATLRRSARRVRPGPRLALAAMAVLTVALVMLWRAVLPSPGPDQGATPPPGSAGSDGTPGTSSPTPQPPASPPPETQEPPPPPEPPQVSVQAEGTRILYTVSADRIEVTLAASGRCWLRVVADGRLAYEGTVSAGESLRFEAGTDLRIRAGNPAALKVNVNGRDMGTPSDVGPRDLLFRPAG